MPLFVGSVEEASDGWMYWLLDSGAACSVLAEQNKECYKRVSRGRDVSGRYLAANGTPVQMGGKVLASVLFAVERSDGTQDSQEFQLECNIGQTAHNIISTTQLMKKGWTFVQSNSGSFLVHEPTKTFIGEVLYWGSCPWIRVASDGQAGVPKTRAKKAIQAVVSGDGVVQESTEMTRHILTGHYPYDPNCIECAQGRGVGRSPRRPRRERILEIQADFFFLGRVSDKYKFILLRQVLSGLLGTTAVGPNVNVTAQQIRQILVEFGVSGSDGPPIDIWTDAATDVGELLRRSAINREFTLSRAGPQEHNVIGSAERGVREVKEAIAVVRLELAKHQLDIVDSLVGWDGICRYVVAMHNLHGKKFGKTPRELLRDSPASKENPVSAMFCSQVLAETPESVKSIGRFVTAAYLWPVRNSFAHFVVAKIEGELKYFQAKNWFFRYIVLMNWFSVSSSRHTMDRSGRLKIIHLWKLFPVTSWSCQEGFHHQIQQVRHQVARRVILGKASIPLPVRRGIRSGWSRMMSLHLGRRWLFLHHLVMLSLTCLMINRKLLDMSTFLRLRKDQMVRRLQFLIGAVMIVRSEGRLKWSLHLILTLPGDVQRASPGWMFLEFVTMLSVERRELVFKLNHHLQGPRWVCHLVLHLPWLCRIFLQLH